MRDTRLRTPTLDEFAGIAEQAWDGLPEAFRAMCGRVVIRVDDFADAETLEMMEIDDPYELTGLYHGVDLIHKSHFDAHPEPDRVFLYRKPIVAEWRARGDVTLEHLVAHVLVHEIGHHFGLSDEDMHRIEAEAG